MLSLGSLELKKAPRNGIAGAARSVLPPGVRRGVFGAEVE